MTVLEQIEDLDGESSVKDFKNIMKAQYSDINTLAENYQDILEKTAVNPYKNLLSGQDKRDKDKAATAMLKAVVRKNPEELQKLGFLPVSDARFIEGKEHEFETALFANAAGRAVEKASLGTPIRGDSATGSYLVPSAWYDEVFRVAGQSSVMMGKVRTINMNQRTVNCVGLASAPEFTEVADETTAKTESAPTFEDMTLSCETFAAWLAVTEELLEDSVSNLGTLFQELYGEAWGSMFDYQVLKANSGGSDTFSGMLYDSNVNDVAMGAGNSSYTNTTFDHLVDLENSISDAVGENGLRGASFIMARKVFNHLKTVKDDNGYYVYNKPEAGTPGSIWGYPYIISDQMPAPIVGGEPFLILGNPKYWLYGDRVGLQVRVFDQTAGAMEYDQVYFRARVRAAFLAGRPKAFARLSTTA